MVKLCRAWFYLVRPHSSPRHLDGLLKLKTAWPNSGRNSVLTGLRIRVTRPRPCQNLIPHLVDQPSLLNLRGFPTRNPWAHPRGRIASSNRLLCNPFTIPVLPRLHMFFLRDHFTPGNHSTEDKLYRTNLDPQSSIRLMDTLSTTIMDTATSMLTCLLTLEFNTQAQWFNKGP